MPPERLVAAAGFDVPEGYRVLSDERGVRIVPAGLTAQRMADRRRPGSSSPSSAGGSRTATSPSSPRCTAWPAGASSSSPPPRPSRRRSGEESAAGLPRARLRRRGGAADRRGTPAASPTTRDLIARVGAYGSVYFTGGDQAKIVGRAGARRRRDAAPRRDPRRPGRRRPRGRLERRRGDDVAADDPRRHLDRVGRARRHHDPEAARPADRRPASASSPTAWSTSTSSSAAGSAGWSSRWPRAGRAPRLRHRREHRAPRRGRRRAGLRRVRRDARRHGPGHGRPRRRGASATSASATSTTATAIDLARFRPEPGAGKRRVRKREIAYRAPARSRRNVFGAYTLYDLMARLVLGDPAVYDRRPAEAFDARSGINVTVEIERQPRRSRGPDRHARERPADVGARTSAARSAASS